MIILLFVINVQILPIAYMEMKEKG